MTLKRTLRCFFTVFLLCAAHLRGESTILTKADTHVQIISGISYLVDTNHTYEVADVLSGRYAFQPFKNGTLNLGNNLFANWVAFTVRNETNDPNVILEIANPALDSIFIYDPIDDGRLRTIKLGEAYPFRNRLKPNAAFTVPLHILPHTEQQVYMKISSADALLVPLSIGMPDTMFLRDKYKDIFWGLYIGLMLSMLLYNVFIYVVTKDRDYIYYVFYVSSVLLTQINISGYAYQILWPDNTTIAFLSPFFTPFISGCASIAFTRRFLRTRNFTPKLDRIFIVIYITYIVGFGLALAGKYEPGLGIINLSAMVVSFLILTVAIRIVYLRYRPAAYFLVAWTVFLIGIFVFIFVNAGVLPYNSFTIYMMPVGSAMEVILLSFALADKINILKKEKAISQAQALREAEKNSQLIRSQNVVLETKVAERTSELKNLNSELSTAIADLKGAQAQLVESEKMASLGQLTAGIAHEINNPINFVISNVKPLKRDVTMLVDVIAQVEEMLKDNPADEPIVQKMSVIKEEIEYDYLITEIDFLLKGISEGSERTAEIVKGLRIFARVDENDLKTTNIHDGIDSTIIIVNTLLTDKIVVEKDYGEVAVIECYPGKLNQAFLNIISNSIHAIKARYKEQHGGRLVVRTRAENGFLHISIKDNGTGMPEEVKHKIFEPFYSTKEVGEGTGLGLSIAYNIVKKHNGKIEFHSELNVGTEFILSIPLNQHPS